MEEEKINAVFSCTIKEDEKSHWSYASFRTINYSKKTIGVSGYNLPTEKGLAVTLYGEWTKSNDKAFFKCSHYDILKAANQSAIEAYLKSLHVGIGQAKAAMIYSAFGSRAWDVIENNPMELTKIPGINKKTVHKLIDAVQKFYQVKVLVEITSRAGIDLTASQIRRIQERLGNNCMEIIKDNPYSITKIIKFDKADRIAESLGFPHDSPARIRAGIVELLRLEGLRGNVCCPLKTKDEDFVAKLGAFLDVDEATCKEGIRRECDRGNIVYSGGLLYLAESFEEELLISTVLTNFIKDGCPVITKLDGLIDAYQRTAAFPLSLNQIEAVKMVFKYPISIITGCPGTGKTTVIKAILNLHGKIYGRDSHPLLLAPTGKAARRMSESSGYSAQTIHSAVGYRGEDVPVDESIQINENLVIVDESSMMDQSIMSILLSKIQRGTRLVFVGDPQQLPSVGAGNILADMISSGVIPVTKLDVIFRQAKENPIIGNCLKISKGEKDLTFAETFTFEDIRDEKKLFIRAISLYIYAAERDGIDNVLLLNPQRRNCNLTVDNFNKTIQTHLHKKELFGLKKMEGSIGIKCGATTFYEGDRVMQLKNTEFAKNGDVGVITSISKAPDPDDMGRWKYTATIDFGNGPELYEPFEMEDLELAYCTTVHKSQGMEFKTIIEVVSSMHPAMLKRNLIYTGISRAKENVYLLGDMPALQKSIDADYEAKRYTSLSDRLKIM